MDLDNLDLNKSGAFIIGLSDCGEKITSAGGRVSTQEGTVLGIWQKSQDCEKNAKLIDKVTRSGHNSVVEHTYFNLAFQNVTAVVEQFVIEFRLASFTVKSRRYVDYSRGCGRKLQKPYGKALRSVQRILRGRSTQRGREIPFAVLPFFQLLLQHKRA